MAATVAKRLLEARANPMPANKHGKNPLMPGAYSLRALALRLANRRLRVYTLGLPLRFEIIAIQAATSQSQWFMGEGQVLGPGYL